MLLWTGIGAVVAGLALVFAGLRGRRVDDHPTCRRCRYDLSGVEGSGVCPECGAHLDDGSGVRIGNRERVTVLVCAGLLVLVGGLVGAGVGGYRKWRDSRPLSVMPLAWLQGRAFSVERPSVEAAKEIERRVAEGLLTAPEMIAVAEAVMTYSSRLGDSNLPFEDAVQFWYTHSGRLARTLAGDPRLSAVQRRALRQDAEICRLRVDRCGEHLCFSLVYRDLIIGTSSDVVQGVKVESVFVDGRAAQFTLDPKTVHKELFGGIGFVRAGKVDAAAGSARGYSVLEVRYRVRWRNVISTWWTSGVATRRIDAE